MGWGCSAHRPCLSRDNAAMPCQGTRAPSRCMCSTRYWLYRLVAAVTSRLGTRIKTDESRVGLLRRSSSLIVPASQPRSRQSHGTRPHRGLGSCHADGSLVCVGAMLCGLQARTRRTGNSVHQRSGSNLRTETEQHYASLRVLPCGADIRETERGQ